MNWLQTANPGCAYILENVALQLHPQESICKEALVINYQVGEPLVMDAVQVGSYAHRLRNFWTNLVSVEVLRAALLHTRRNPEACLTDVLEPGHLLRPVLHSETPPLIPVNVPGQVRKVLPTLVTHANSHAFRGDGPGLVLDQFTQQWVEPTAVERERVMGFQDETTAAPTITKKQRRAALGRAMDMHSITWLVSVCLAFQMFFHPATRALTSFHTAMCPPDVVHLPFPGFAHWSFDVDAGGGGHVAYRTFRFCQESVNRSTRHTYAAIKLGGDGTGKPIQNSSTMDKGTRAYTAETFPWTIGNQLTEQEQGQVKKLLCRYADCFAFNMKELGRCNVLDFCIPTNTTEPIFKRKHRLSPAEWELVDASCKELAEAGLIQPSQSDYAAATVLPAKKDSQSLWTEKRMCGDYRPLNEVTPQDRYPMPTPEEMFDNIGKSRIFSILDLRQGFNQIPVAEEDTICKTAFHGSG